MYQSVDLLFLVGKWIEKQFFHIHGTTTLLVVQKHSYLYTNQTKVHIQSKNFDIYF